MAWKSFYAATGLVCAAALPVYSGSEGTEFIPKGPCVIAANHSGFLDGPLLALAYARALYTPLHMIAYSEPFAHWLWGWILRSGKCIPFGRGSRASQAAMLRTALGWLKAGEAVGIFPEGHINHRQRLNKPRSGAAMLALEAGVPIVPATVRGSAECLPPGTWVPQKFRAIRVCFGQPVELMEKEYEYRWLDREQRRAMIDNVSYRVMSAISVMCGKPQWVAPEREA